MSIKAKPCISDFPEPLVKSWVQSPGNETGVFSTWNVPRQSRQELTMSGMLVKINIRQQAIMEIVKETLVATIRN